MAQEEAKEEAKRMKEDPLSSLPEDSKFGIQRMLEMARDDPFHYMDDEAKLRVQKARTDLRCGVCRRVLQESFDVVSSKPRSMQSEHDILAVLERMCEGGPDLSIPSYFGVDPPPLPPDWTDRWRPKLDKAGRYSLRPWPKKGKKARQAWRKQSADGKQTPPTADESEQAWSHLCLRALQSRCFGAM